MKRILLAVILCLSTPYFLASEEITEVQLMSIWISKVSQQKCDAELEAKMKKNGASIPDIFKAKIDNSYEQYLEFPESPDGWFNHFQKLHNKQKELVGSCKFAMTYPYVLTSSMALLSAGADYNKYEIQIKGLMSMTNEFFTEMDKHPEAVKMLEQFEMWYQLDKNPTTERMLEYLRTQQ